MAPTNPATSASQEIPKLVSLATESIFVRADASRAGALLDRAERLVPALSREFQRESARIQIEAARVDLARLREQLARMAAA